MENMDKEFNVPKWVLIVWSKYRKCPRIYQLNLSAQAQKFWILMKKRLHWASVVRVAVCALDNNAEAGPPTLPLVPLPLVPLPCYCAMQYTMG